MNGKCQSNQVQLLFPAQYLLLHLHRRIMSSYSAFKEYDKGAAFEFLICAQRKSVWNKIHCLGNEPTPVCRRLSSKSPSNEKQNFQIPGAKKRMYFNEIRVIT